MWTPPPDSSFITGERNSFHIVDYVLFGLMLATSASIGVFYGIKDRKKNNTKDFLLAGGNMSAWPVALSLLASFMSAITLLGTPSEMYKYGTMYWWIGLGYPLMIFGAAQVFLPIFYNLRLTSVYEYLEHRFSKGVRTAGAITFCTQMLLYMAIVLYAPSLALNAVTGFTLWGSVVSVAIICTLYTTFGGMKAVLWTDSFQVLVMFAGLLAVLIQGAIELGGFENAWEVAEERNRIWFTDFRPDPSIRHSAWSLCIGGCFTWLAIYGTNQAQVQRAMTCPSLKLAQRALWMNLFGLFLILYLGCLIGIVIFAYYSLCDPQSFGTITAADQLLPLFVLDVLGHIPGVPGVFVACLFSGALSTISSGLNSLSAVILQDIFKVYIFKDLSESRATNISRATAFVLGFVCLGLSYVASLMGDVLQAALSLFGMIAGPLLGLFTLGIIFPWANTYGAFAGLFSSLALMFWIGIGAQIYKPPAKPIPPSINTSYCNWSLTSTVEPITVSSWNFINTTIETTPAVEEHGGDYPLYTLSYMWYSATAVLAVVVIGLIVSFATGANKPQDVDPRLICPLVDVLFPYLPDSWRKPFRFGLVHKGKYDSTTPIWTKSAEVNSHINPTFTTADSDDQKKQIQNGGNDGKDHTVLPLDTVNKDGDNGQANNIPTSYDNHVDTTQL